MNMFARKPKTVSNQAAADESNRKKLASKILDTKKEINSRLRYLRNYIESTENPLELKLFFDQNHSHIYFIFYESFVQAESNLKQKINKVHRDELELVLFIFQKILLLQPERVNQRWQSRSIGRLLQKLLHISNAKSIKVTGLRLFLIWYQILNKNRTQFEELMFQKLIQGFDLFHSNAHMSSIGLDILNAEAQKVFHNQANASAMPFSASSSNAKSTIYQFEITHLIGHLFHSSTQSSGSSGSQQSGQVSQQQQALSLSSQSQANGSASISSIQSFTQSNNIYSLTAEFLKHMLSFMQNDFILVEWSSDRFKQSMLAYEFLFDEFKRFYLSYMFPNAFIKHSSSGSSLATAPSTSSLNVFTSLDFFLNKVFLMMDQNRIVIMSQSNLTFIKKKSKLNIYLRRKLNILLELFKHVPHMYFLSLDNENFLFLRRIKNLGCLSLRVSGL
ncbi:ral GTPase-activating subunit alpha-1 [Brachionus plicatilis]|uniref:Ral GTPase-activating subunit alpha-1 n=1 Tax=Brachionus plicatilis TaxID=10195 RepID=A0A3M7SJW1_BRAPC|nr:ral GTPase-activating subunit alpha-1 [Brachionus plicatilis]